MADPARTTDQLTDQARELAGKPVGDQLAWAVEVAPDLPLPGGGATLQRWRALAAVGAGDLGVARVLEPHADALAILAEAGVTGPSGAASYGVWAAEGPGARLEAAQDRDGSWSLSGRKPWCSLAGDVDRALVTAWSGERRGLFDLDVRAPRTRVEPGAWSELALKGVVTSTVSVDAAPALPVGDLGFYIGRDGFAWGGIGVAAVWWGGALAVAGRVLAQASRREPDQVGQVHLGAIDAALASTRALLEAAAAQVDAAATTPGGPQAAALLAARVRQVVADTVELVLHHAAHALGPGPLAHEAEHAQRVADLGLYVRQHHGERDQAALGRLVLGDAGSTGWSRW